MEFCGTIARLRYAKDDSAKATMTQPMFRTAWRACQPDCVSRPKRSPSIMTRKEFRASKERSGVAQFDFLKHSFDQKNLIGLARCFLRRVSRGSTTRLLDCSLSPLSGMARILSISLEWRFGFSAGRSIPCNCISRIEFLVLF